MGLRLRVHTEPILRDMTPHVVTFREGTNDTWNITWPYGIDVTATRKTETRETMVLVGGHR